MLVQKFLRENSLEALVEQYAIKAVEHPTDGRVILNYNQINSIKTDPLVMECRGLTLNKNDNWNIVSRTFDRFFNMGEHLELTDTFDWSNFTCVSKEDGSIMPYYFFEDRWHVNTRGSFADSECGFSEKSWDDLFFELLPKNLNCADLDKNVTYIFEFCSIHNKIVRNYTEPKLYLIGMRSNSINDGSFEYSNTELNEEAKKFCFDRPEMYKFKSIEEIKKFLQEQEKNDPSFEGVVIQDKSGLRMKIKNSTYLALHRLRGENDNLWNPKYLIPFVLSGEEKELLVYFKEVEEAFYKCKDLVDEAFNDLLVVFNLVKDIEDQKEFALSVTKVYSTSFNGLLFMLKKQYGTAMSEDNLKELWRSSGELIHKVLYKGK